MVHAIYESDWIDCPIHYKKKLSFIMMRCQKGLKIYGGNIFTVSLPTFMAVGKLKKFKNSHIPLNDNVSIFVYRAFQNWGAILSQCVLHKKKIEQKVHNYLKRQIKRVKTYLWAFIEFLYNV